MFRLKDELLKNIDLILLVLSINGFSFTIGQITGIIRAEKSIEYAMDHFCSIVLFMSLILFVISFARIMEKGIVHDRKK